MLGMKGYNTPALRRELANYISGYVDGEGCFSVSFSRRQKLNFIAFLLKSAKQRDCLRFVEICQRIKNLEHLKKSTLAKIMKSAYAMNGAGKRKFTLDVILGTL